ncbi:MAG: hypothetical protein NXI31_18575 [bacterium]|nr:hypothetical protein [bacterium]
MRVAPAGSAAVVLAALALIPSAGLSQDPTRFDRARAAAIAATDERDRARHAASAAGEFLRLPPRSTARRERLGPGLQMLLLADKVDTAAELVATLDVTAPQPADVVAAAMQTHARRGRLALFLRWHDRGLELEYDATVARALRQTETLLMPLADNALRRGETVSGVRTFERLAALEPPAGWRLSNLALTYRCVGRLEAAEGGYRRALELTPGDNQIHNDYGLLLRATGRVDAARTAFQRSYALDTATPGGRAGQGPGITNLIYEHALLRPDATPPSPDPLPLGSAALVVRPSAKMLSRLVLDLALDRLPTRR